LLPKAAEAAAAVGRAGSPRGRDADELALLRVEEAHRLEAERLDAETAEAAEAEAAEAARRAKEERLEAEDAESARRAEEERLEIEVAEAADSWVDYKKRRPECEGQLVKKRVAEYEGQKPEERAAVPWACLRFLGKDRRGKPVRCGLKAGPLCGDCQALAHHEASWEKRDDPQQLAWKDWDDWRHWVDWKKDDWNGRHHGKPDAHRSAPQGARSKAKEPVQVRVTNIPRDLDIGDIIGTFEEACGQILKCELQAGNARIWFQDADAAAKAVTRFDRGDLNGKVISVTYPHYTSAVDEYDMLS